MSRSLLTALRNSDIKKLRDQGAIQLGVFDKLNMAEIFSPDFPDERLIVCRNPLLAQERTRKRLELLAVTQARLEEVEERVKREMQPLRGNVEIARAVEKALGRHKMGKHFTLSIEDDSFSWTRDELSIEKEAQLDGFYVIRTSVPAQQLSADEAVAAYKDLATVERAFRTLKGVDLKVRPIHHRLEKRVRSHVFLCMLAYYVEYHMRQWLAPIIFQDDDRDAAAMARADIVSPAVRSDSAHHKIASKVTQDGMPVHSFQSLIGDLATISLNTITPKGNLPSFTMVTRPTPLQKRAFELMGVAAP